MTMIGPISMTRSEALPSLVNLQLLVVDDDDDTREFLIALLEEEGARVRSASSVAEALAALEISWPDVLLSDIGMPGADGYELIARVREMEALRGGMMPAIALTALRQRVRAPASAGSWFPDALI